MMDIERIAADRDQLWAEAVCWYREGRPWRLLGDELDVAAEEQDRHFETDAWEDHVVAHLFYENAGAQEAAHALRRRHAPLKGVVVKDILTNVIRVPIDRQGTLDKRRVSAILTRLGFVQGPVQCANPTDPDDRRPTRVYWWVSEDASKYPTAPDDTPAAAYESPF
jgi:predicted P-loop ATPase